MTLPKKVCICGETVAKRGLVYVSLKPVRMRVFAMRKLDGRRPRDCTEIAAHACLRPTLGLRDGCVGMRRSADANFAL